ncbi:RPL43A, Ribosomal protein L37AEL43A [Pyrenophora tritici-repentis]|nr:RPL43A, Ribosomal protein L37AEL43A [Pyrenophora tritici-repentis]
MFFTHTFPVANKPFKFMDKVFASLQQQCLPSFMMSRREQEHNRKSTMTAALRSEARQIQHMERRGLTTPDKVDTAKIKKTIISPAKHRRPAHIHTVESRQAMNSMVKMVKGCSSNTKVWTRDSPGIGGMLSRSFDKIAATAATLGEASSADEFEACADGLLHLLNQTAQMLRMLGLGASIPVAGAAMKQLHKILERLQQWEASGQATQAWSRYYDGIVEFFDTTQIARDDVKDLKDITDFFPVSIGTIPDAEDVAMPDAQDVAMSDAQDDNMWDVSDVVEDVSEPMEGSNSTWKPDSGLASPPVDRDPELFELQNGLVGSVPPIFPAIRVDPVAASTLPDDMEPRSQATPLSFGVSLELRPVPSSPPAWTIPQLSGPNSSPSSTMAPGFSMPPPATVPTSSGLNFLPSTPAAFTTVTSNPLPPTGPTFSGLTFLPSTSVASTTVTSNPPPSTTPTFSGLSVLPSTPVASTTVASNPPPVAGPSFSGLKFMPSRPVHLLQSP